RTACHLGGIDLNPDTLWTMEAPNCLHRGHVDRSIPGAVERLIEFDRPLQVVLITISINGSQAIWENIDLAVPDGRCDPSRRGANINRRGPLSD
ncbi:MAG: hypothetical protein JRF07_06890, partial [Deltaproteobacteria bacterium]|nr:hypothetical protein [Deltaproteobacteria bacterium]